jgi:phosphoglycerate dehydrogenase-like enzyme
VPVPTSSTPPLIVVTWPHYDPHHPELGGALTDAGLRLRLAPKLGARSVVELRDLLAGASGAIVSTDPFDRLVLASCPQLRIVARVGVGSDSVDLDAATEQGIAVTITPGANEDSVADHTLALMLAVLRRVAEQDAAIRRGEWRRTGDATPWQLSGTTVGLVGYGRIGRLVAVRLEGFSVRVIYHDPFDGADSIPLDELLARADVVSLHAPLGPGTERMIGARELGLMPPHAVLINTARGAVVDEAALVTALADGTLRGAGLDVFADEPPRSRRLLSLDNVVLSAHVGGISERSVAEMTRRATRSVVDVLTGGVPRDLANPAVLEHPRFAVRVVAAP